MQPNLKVKIGSLELKNPVMVASGTFGYGEEFHKSVYDISKLGAVVTKGISLLPRDGNPLPRVIETSSGMLNAIGLANVGIEKFLEEKIPFLKKCGANIIVNIFGSTIDEYEKVAALLESSKDIPAVEVNISCPNVKAGGVQFGTDAKLAAEVTSAVRKVFSKTLIVKLSPQVSDIVLIAKSVAEAGADAISLINTFPAMAIDIETKKPVLTNVTGGLSGPAIKPIALKMVCDVSRAINIPVIGMGGIMNFKDAIEFILAGAKAIQIGTANFVNPNVAIEIIGGIKKYCISHKVQDILELTGKLDLSR